MTQSVHTFDQLCYLWNFQKLEVLASGTAVQPEHNMSVLAETIRLDSAPVVVIPYEDESSGAASEESEHSEGIPAWNDRMPSSFPDDIKEGAKLRFLAYLDVWQRCASRIQAVVAELHNTVVNSVLGEIENAYRPRDIILPHLEMPVMLLVGDYRSAGLVVDSVVHDLKGIQQPNAPGYPESDSKSSQSYEPMPVVRLSSKDFVGLASALRALIGGFVCSQTGPETLVSKKRPNRTTLDYSDIQTLEAWYYSLGPDSLPDSQRKLIVYVPSVELCNSNILQDFFHICCSRITRLPFIFILTSKSSQVMRSLIALDGLRLMEIRMFQLEGGCSLFDDLTQGLFLSPSFDPGFQPTPSFFDHLFHGYMHQEHSIDSFCTTFQLILARHFSSPTSIFLRTRVLGSKHLALERIRSPESLSFRHKLHQMVRDAIIKYPNADATIRILERRETSGSSRHSTTTPHPLRDEWVLDYISQAKDAFKERATSWRMAIRVLRMLLCTTGSKSVDVSLTSLIRAVLQETVMANEVAYLLRRIGKLTLEPLNDVCERVESLCQKLQGVPGLDELLAIAKDWRTWMKETIDALSTKPSNKSLDRQGFQFSSLVEVPSEITSLSDKMATSLADYFRNHLRSLSDVPLHELWHVNSDLSPAQYLNPSIQQSLTRTLASDYMAHDSSEAGPVGIAHRELPDTPVVFRRYLESGKIINVYDWFESFAQAMIDEPGLKVVKNVQAIGDLEDATTRTAAYPIQNRDMDADDPELRKEGADPIAFSEALPSDNSDWKRELQARFLHSLHELDILGLIKATGRKRDHVVRTVFDGPR